jgi:uncharacterized membrane protein
LQADIAAKLRDRASASVIVRPLLFIGYGLVAALATLGADAFLGHEFVPAWLRFEAGAARMLFTTLAGAMLTLAGITFWVRAAAVQMAASQFTARVVQGFLHDWFQQSMMGFLLGIFAYLVVVLRAIPPSGDDVPQVAVIGGVALAAAAVLAVLGAIRNGVESMQAGELARRITDDTVERIRLYHPPLPPRREPRALREPPTRVGHVVRATGSGWVQEIREGRILGSLPHDAIVRLEVRIGLFVKQGRALCTVWTDETMWLDTDERIRRAVRLGHARTTQHDIHYGLQQLVDVARGSLTHGTADPGAAYETIVQLEIVLRELLSRELPPTTYLDHAGRQMIRRRDYSIDDYVRVAFDQLRTVAAPHPVVTIALLEAIGALVAELHQAGRGDRVAPLIEQARLTVRASERADLLDADLAHVRSVAHRHGLVGPGSHQPAHP